MRPQAGGVIPLGCPTTNSPIPHPLSEQRSVTQLSPVGNASVRTDTFGAHRAVPPNNALFAFLSMTGALLSLTGKQIMHYWGGLLGAPRKYRCAPRRFPLGKAV